MYIVVGRIVLIKMDGNNPIDNKKAGKKKICKKYKTPQFLALGFRAYNQHPSSQPAGFLESRGESGISRCFFTATSAVCVTGLAVVDTANTHSTFGQIVVML